jgi:hypothetical protein
MLSRVSSGTATRMARFGGAQSVPFARANPAATLVRFRPTAAFEDAQLQHHRFAPKKMTLIGAKVADPEDYVCVHGVRGGQPRARNRAPLRPARAPPLTRPPPPRAPPRCRCPRHACSMPHFVYSEGEMQAVKVTQRPVSTMQDKVANGVMRLLRVTFDTATGYGTSAHLSKAKYLNVRVRRGGRGADARGARGRGDARVITQQPAHAPRHRQHCPPVTPPARSA